MAKANGGAGDRLWPAGALRGRRATGRRALLGGAALALAACHTEDLRAKDHGALLPAVRARLGKPDAALQLELGGEYGAGTFVLADGAHDYDFTCGHAATAYVTRSTIAEFTVLSGIGAADVGIDGAATHYGAAGLGPFAGCEFSVHPVPWLGPYARASGTWAGNLFHSRVECGLDYRVDERMALQLAYARLVTEVDENSPFVAGDRARVETEGLHVGLAFRF